MKEVSEPLRIEVCFNSTVHVLFPAPVTYVDLGSMNIIAGKADGAENVVRVKAAIRDFEGETNFSVICANGCLYTFVVTYSDEPSRLSVEIGDNAIPAVGADDPDKRPFVRLNELGEQTPPQSEGSWLRSTRTTCGILKPSAARNTAYKRFSKGYIFRAT